MQPAEMGQRADGGQGTGFRLEEIDRRARIAEEDVVRNLPFRAEAAAVGEAVPINQAKVPAGRKVKKS